MSGFDHVQDTPMEAGDGITVVKDTNIAEDGDVILVVGEKGTRIRVHSLFLRFASRVFAAMLGPCYAEGQDLNGSRTKEIHLPADDPQAMMMLCSILHHRNDTITSNATAPTVFQIARIADKYACVEALRFARKELLQWTTEDPVLLVLTLAASYLMKDSNSFEQLAGKLLECHGGPFQDIIDGEARIFLPPNTIGKYKPLPRL